MYDTTEEATTVLQQPSRHSKHCVAAVVIDRSHFRTALNYPFTANDKIHQTIKKDRSMSKLNQDKTYQSQNVLTRGKTYQLKS